MLQKINCDEIQWTGSAEAFGMPELYTQQTENHHELKTLLESQIEIQNSDGKCLWTRSNPFTECVNYYEQSGVGTGNQQETLENISRLLPAVLQQQANQTELLSQCQPRPKSNCSNVESNNIFQTTQAAISITNPTTMTSTERITQDTTTLRSVEFTIQEAALN